MTYKSSDNFTVGSIHVSPQHNTMVNGEDTCRLQPKAMAVLYYLAKNNDRVISNDELLDHVWKGRVVTHSSIQKCVNALRSAFTELDDSTEYVVYFSKQGYQLVTPNIILNNKSGGIVSSQVSPRYFAFFITIICTLIASYFVYQQYPFHGNIKKMSDHIDITQFTQVKPYISNTGSEKVIEPHIGSNRVAFIRDEFNSKGLEQESHLFIRGTNGQEWQASVARGNFIALSWSLSGRNLVAIDVHNENKRTLGTNTQKSSVDYYTFHIYTLDFKGEKVIEKNLLSHWQGNVSSVSWWDEGILEFAAFQGSQNERARYRYSIADQNLSVLTTPSDGGRLLTSHIMNQQTATLSVLKAGEQIQFLDENQELISKWSIPFNVISMSWIPDGKGLLLLSEQNQLSILYRDGQLNAVDYFPKVNGRILHVRSINKGSSIVLTVETSLEKEKPSIDHSEKAINEDITILPERFMEKGGGFIYSNAPNH
jgi:DNA-binding winged helix-turn-helix (wHTH) protein